MVINDTSIKPYKYATVITIYHDIESRLIYISEIETDKKHITIAKLLEL